MGKTLFELAKQAQPDYPHQIILAKVDGKLHELKDMEIENEKVEYIICRVAGGTGSSHRQQRETERSRRGTPCCTYRYRLWSLAGCVHSGRTLFLFCL